MRRLTLRKETLAQLSDATLRGVAGGTHLCVTGPCTHGCLSLDIGCPTLDIACPTNPITDCIPTLDVCVEIKATIVCL